MNPEWMHAKRLAKVDAPHAEDIPWTVEHVMYLRARLSAGPRHLIHRHSLLFIYLNHPKLLDLAHRILRTLPRLSIPPQLPK